MPRYGNQTYCLSPTIIDAMELTPHQMERLLISKLLLDQGMKQLEVGGQYSEGFAVLSLHDCVEMVLRIIGECVEATFREYEPFSGLIEKIEKRTDETIPWRQELFRLNKARVNFKHMGMLPRIEDINNISRCVNSFLYQSCERHLSVDYTDISRGDAVQNENVRRKLKEAERDCIEGKYSDAIRKSAVLWYDVMSLFPNTEEKRQYRSFDIPELEGNDIYIRNALENLTRKLEDEFSTIYSEMRLLINGIDLKNSRRFSAITPHVHRTSGGRTFITQTRGDETYDYADAKFCIEFLIDTALLAEQNSRDLTYV